MGVNFGPSSTKEQSLGNKLPFMVIQMSSQTTSKNQHLRKPQRWAVRHVKMPQLIL